jgi:hypothetical protein
MNHHHRKTLHALFAHPLSGNISLKEVERVLRDLGAEVKTANGSRLGVSFRGQTAHFHDHGGALSKDEAVQIRKFLETCGVDPGRDYPL